MSGIVKSADYSKQVTLIVEKKNAAAAGDHDGDDSDNDDS